MSRFDLRCGDSRVLLRDLADNSVDSGICDPPYALDSIVKRYGGENAAPTKSKIGALGAYSRSSRGFMGQQWDTGDTAFDPEFWAEVWRVLKPGAWLVAFSGTRTYHRLAVAIEDAGFEISDQLAWMYGSGFPKSHKIAVYIERTLCYRFEVGDEQHWFYRDDNAPMRKEPPFRHPEANRWWGWGTALKPAWEPVCVAQKPLDGTLAENALTWGTGGINIEACRIETDDVVETLTDRLNRRRDGEASADRSYGDKGATNFSPKPGPRGGDENGRFPANVVHDGSTEVYAAFPQSEGMKAAISPDQTGHMTVNVYNAFKGSRYGREPRGDTGSAARFFKAGDYDDEDWLWQKFPLLASIAGQNSYQLNDPVASALGDAVTSVVRVPGQISLRDRFTNVTANELRRLCEHATQVIQNFGERCLQGLPLDEPFQLPSAVSAAVQRMPTGIIEITISRWRSDGSVDPVTFDITPMNSALGGKGSAPSTDKARHFYGSKASRRDRNEGGVDNPHPTVKPTDLMRWLCRLFTPAGGVILDPFMGSGSTGKAAMLEGFRFIGCDLSADYVAVAQRRIEHAARRYEVNPPQDDLFGGG